MDDAITKAEEQVEKFTEMAKETKVLLTRIFTVVQFLLVRAIFKKSCLPAGVRILNQSELTFCFINQSGVNCNLAPLRFPALARGCSRACRRLHRIASSFYWLIMMFTFFIGSVDVNTQVLVVVQVGKSC